MQQSSEQVEERDLTKEQNLRVFKMVHTVFEELGKWVIPFNRNRRGPNNPEPERQAYEAIAKNVTVRYAFDEDVQLRDIKRVDAESKKIIDILAELTLDDEDEVPSKFYDCAIELLQAIGQAKLPFLSNDKPDVEAEVVKVEIDMYRAFVKGKVLATLKKYDIRLRESVFVFDIMQGIRHNVYFTTDHSLEIIKQVADSVVYQVKDIHSLTIREVANKLPVDNNEETGQKPVQP